MIFLDEIRLGSSLMAVTNTDVAG